MLKENRTGGAVLSRASLHLLEACKLCLEPLSVFLQVCLPGLSDPVFPPD